MPYRWIDFFTDPILRGPTIGSIFMCAAVSLIGVVVFIRRKSLVGETLSHAAYPGLILGAFVCSLFPFVGEEILFYFLLAGSFISSAFAVFLLQRLQKRYNVKSDAALCFILSSFLGIGVLLASRMQFVNPIWYRQVQTFLYGQAATMTDLYIWIYGILFVIISSCVVVFYHPLRLVYFDATFADSLGFSLKIFERLFFFLLILAVIVAMKSVGIVLLSGMFIAPALTARRLTHHLSWMFFFASCIGAICGFLGNYFSVKLSEWMPKSHVIFPTGPMIVLLASFLCLVVLVFSKSKVKKIPFSCHEEVFLKSLECIGGKGTFHQIHHYMQKNRFFTFFLLQKALRKEIVIRKNKIYSFSEKGEEKLKQIVEAHRYLSDWIISKGPGEKRSYESVEGIKRLKEEGYDGLGV